MKNYKIASMSVLLALSLLAGCENAQDESNAESNGQPDNESNLQSGEAEPTTAPQDSDNQSNVSAGKKDAYLKKLNEMEQADRYEEPASTTVGLVEQETKRYEQWDKMLNEIYGVLIEQLDPEQLDALRQEQRNWVKERDETAKEASQKYSGGSMESLEYVATQAELTRERCYALVAKYFK